jgi:hypothetical protein
MPIKEDMVRENRKKKKQYDRMQSFLKILKGFGITILIFAIIAVAGVIILDRVQTKSEIKKLTDAGFYGEVELSPKVSVNAVLHGNEDSMYTIIPIHDIGEEDFNIAMHTMLKPIDNAVQYALINRPGHGFSDDTNVTRTIKVIVDEYRLIVNKLNIDNNIILVTSGFGGVYANYWANMYPGEIAGIIFLDFEEYATDFEQIDEKAATQFEILSCKLGFQRFAKVENLRTKSNLSSKDDSDVLKIMYTNSCYTKARNAEIANSKDNYESAFKKTNDVPKVLVSSLGGFDTNEEVMKFVEYKNKQNESLGIAPLIEGDQFPTNYLSDYISKSQSQFVKNKINFVDKTSKCVLTKIPGESKIYRYNPFATQTLIKDFILYINNSKPKLNDKYTDVHAEGWEQSQQNTEQTTSK